MSSTSYDERKSQLPKPQHINNEFLHLQMFYQLLFNNNAKFYAELGKAYRQEWNYFEGWDTFNTNQKDKNWFVKTACDITKTNLLPFFDAWGLGISPEVRRQIEDQDHPLPVKNRTTKIIKCEIKLKFKLIKKIDAASSNTKGSYPLNFA